MNNENVIKSLESELVHVMNEIRIANIELSKSKAVAVAEDDEHSVGYLSGRLSALDGLDGFRVFIEKTLDANKKSESVMELVEHRLAYIISEVKTATSLLSDPYLCKTWSGKLSVIKDEQAFLEKLLETE